MKIKKHLSYLLCAAIVLSAQGASADNEAATKLSFSDQPTDAELSAARVFDEPLVPLNAQSNARENKALSLALTAYVQQTRADDCSSLADFADDYPQSRWTPSLLLHLGTEYYNDGYFSKALEAWQRAWAQFQTNSSAGPRPQADRALGELARMYARIGRVAQLSDLLDSVQGRDLTGPGAELVHQTRQAHWLMLNKPDYSFGCGPSALDRILLHFAPSKAGSPVLWQCKSGTNGFSLTQVADISRKLGMNYQMAYRRPGAPLILPSVIHWKLGHYAALIERRGDRVLVQDYTFVMSEWVSERALNEEGSGYFLVPPGKLPARWRAVSAAEGQTVWGRGVVNGNDQNATTWLDKIAEIYINGPIDNSPWEEYLERKREQVLRHREDTLYQDKIDTVNREKAAQATKEKAWQDAENERLKELDNSRNKDELEKTGTWAEEENVAQILFNNIRIEWFPGMDEAVQRDAIKFQLWHSFNKTHDEIADETADLIRSHPQSTVEPPSLSEVQPLTELDSVTPTAASPDDVFVPTDYAPDFSTPEENSGPADEIMFNDRNSRAIPDAVPGGALPKALGMATYHMHALLASLTLVDTPVAFESPLGPQVAFTANYNQLEANQPASFYYSNLGPDWDCSWLSYVTDNPTSPGADVSLYLDGGGTLEFNNFNSTNNSYMPEVMSHTVLVLLTNAYELRYPDGSRREYSRSDGSTGSTRRIFLTQVIDQAGNVVQLNYDSQLRVTNVVNAIGQAMTFYYTNTAYPWAITSVVDPFGRTAQLLYNSNGLLIQITDALGLTSHFTYGANDFITALTTPYGTTTFTTGETNGGSFLTATDPLGETEAIESSQSLPVPTSDPASEVPHGLSTFNLYLDARDSFYWDKKAFTEGAWNWSKAHIYHWLHESPAGLLASRILESKKDPLESRIWCNYPGEYTNIGAPLYLDAAYSGASDEPSVIARVLDDGTTQLSTYSYNAIGNVTNTTDPLGRNFTYSYASNAVDLVAASMTRDGQNQLLGSVTYNSQHQPLTITDAAGQTSTNTYNARGQLLSTTDPLGETTTFVYDTNGFLLSMTGPLQTTNDVFSFAYDNCNRIQTVTDTEGYTLAFTYDNFDRLLSMTHPDGTSEQFVYNRLDLAASSDRLGRWTTNTYDADRHLVQTLDPLGLATQYQYDHSGLLTAMFDPLGRETSWDYDLEDRPVAKHYADGSTVSYTYENSTSRLQFRTDEKGQQTAYQYYEDDDLAGVSYPNAIIATPSVTYTYDTNYDRMVQMQDGTGSTSYTYYPITATPALGAGELESVTGPLPNSAVTYQYDPLGRVTGMTINGVAQTVSRDVLGRPTAVTNALGTFGYTYVDATPRLASASYPNGQTNLYTYYNNLGDERLLQIQDFYPNGSLLSGFGYAYNAIGEITAWTNQWDTLPSLAWNFEYDADDQLVGAARTQGASTVATYTYAYDNAHNRTLAVLNGTTNQFAFNPLNEIAGATAGNVISYHWDAANRLAAILQGGQSIQFTYDGLGRRVGILQETNGVVISDTQYLWCGNQLCEARDNGGATVLNRFFAQGEVLTGGDGVTNLYYTRDHLNSVREALDSGGNLQARFDYDPYGQQTVLVANLAASFGFGGFFQFPPSNLDLALYRQLDVRSGRWLNRNPLGENAGMNLYNYMANDPVNY